MRTERAPRPAGFWIRVGAWLIDGWVFTPIVVLQTPLTSDISLLFPIIILGLIYKPFMECIYGATLGKMVCGIQVVDNQNDSLTLAKTYIRFIPFLLSKIISIMILFQVSKNSQVLLIDMIPFVKTFFTNSELHWSEIDRFFEISALSFPEVFTLVYKSEIFFWIHEKLFLQLLIRIAGSMVLIDCVSAAFTHRKRALHDMVAGSFCVHK